MINTISLGQRGNFGEWSRAITADGFIVIFYCPKCGFQQTLMAPQIDAAGQTRIPFTCHNCDFNEHIMFEDFAEEFPGRKHERRLRRLLQDGLQYAQDAEEERRERLISWHYGPTATGWERAGRGIEIDLLKNELVIWGFNKPEHFRDLFEAVGELHKGWVKYLGYESEEE